MHLQSSHDCHSSGPLQVLDDRQTTVFKRAVDEKYQLKLKVRPPDGDWALQWEVNASCLVQRACTWV